MTSSSSNAADFQGGDLLLLLTSLDPGHWENLGYILKTEVVTPDPETLVDAIRWHYHSRSRDSVRAASKGVINRIGRVAGKDELVSECPPPVPTFAELLTGLAAQLGIETPPEDVIELERQVIYTVLAECLTRMTAAQRVQFFEQSVDVSEVLGDGIMPSSVRGPLQTLSVLGLANTVGGSLYAGAATTLGMVTHAVGLSLPVAMFSGLCATAAFITGPAGWLAASGWLAWRLTGPDWRVLTQLVVYLITVRHRDDVTPQQDL